MRRGCWACLPARQSAATNIRQLAISAIMSVYSFLVDLDDGSSFAGAGFLPDVLYLFCFSRK